ncbi:hypothetical protein EJB05_39325, partial [Eragrostis curvula]
MCCDSLADLQGTRGGSPPGPGLPRQSPSPRGDRRRRRSCALVAHQCSRFPTVSVGHGGNRQRPGRGRTTSRGGAVNRVGGIAPWRELFHSPSTSSWVHDDSAEGIPPSREFMLRLRKPSFSGIEPWKLLFDSCSLSRDVRLAVQDGMTPVKPPDERSSAVARWGNCSLQLTPCQLQN